MNQRKRMGGWSEQPQVMLRAILESPPGIVIFALDAEYRYMAFNENHARTMKHIWGVDIEVGDRMLALIARDDDRDKAQRNFDRALRGESFTLIEEYGSERMQRRSYENVYSPIRDRDGAVVGLTVYLTDVTEHPTLGHASETPRVSHGTELRRSSSRREPLHEDTLSTELVGAVLDRRYHLISLVGEGGMGAVYDAMHIGTGRRVAIKAIASRELAHDLEVVNRFQREAHAAGRIETPFIVQVMDAGYDDALEVPFIAMEFLVGEDLRALLSRVRRLPPRMALRMVGQACLGLQRAHEKGIVHRDIKPANLFVARCEAGVTIKLLDFGIAKISAAMACAAEPSAITTTGRLLGSPLFMSPEQAKGLKTVDARTDIWSLGVVLYQALSGRAPYSECATLGQLILAICSGPPPPLQEVAPWVPPEISRIVERSMRIDVEERYSSAQTMFEDVSRLLPDGLSIAQNELASIESSDAAFEGAESGTGRGISGAEALGQGQRVGGQ
jgi:hypothetical protein